MTSIDHWGSFIQKLDGDGNFIWAKAIGGNIDLGLIPNVSLKVFNLNGQIIFQQENINSNIYRFEINEAPGVYLVELKSQSGRRTFKWLMM